MTLWNLTKVSVLAAALGGTLAVMGRTCIVDAGTETYTQSAGRSAAQTVELGACTASAPQATDYVQEMRRLTVGASIGRRLSTMPPGTVLMFR